jgi:hypothetical protein
LPSNSAARRSLRGLAALGAIALAVPASAAATTICFKYYPNGPHDIHQGTLVDNNAAPHAT